MWPLQIVFSLRLDSSIKNRIQGNGFDRNRLLHETEEELAATCRSPIVESEGELVRNAGNGNIPAITVGSGIPPRLLGYEIRFQLRQVFGVFLYHCPHTTCWGHLNQADTPLPAIRYPGLSV